MFPATPTAAYRGAKTWNPLPLDQQFSKSNLSPKPFMCVYRVFNLNAFMMHFFKRFVNHHFSNQFVEADGDPNKQ